MRIVVSGASGFIGPALISELARRGHEVLTLVRRPATRTGEITWDPSGGGLNPLSLKGVDAAINLSGAPLAGKRWTPSYKRELHTSRTGTARTLATALAEAGGSVLLQGSAIGYYGQHHGGDIIDEQTPAGSDFLADLCADWELAASPAVEAGLRVAYLRTGLVMGPKGGAFAPLLRPMRFGLGGPLGSGRAWWSWITLADHVSAVAQLLDMDIEGPVNLTAPHPVTNARLTAALARAVKRPAVLPVPPFALRAALGEFADEILASRRITPQVLLDAGFQFAHPDVDVAARWLVAGGDRG